MNMDIDSPIIDKGVDALFGHHPERGGPERRQAVFSVLSACLKITDEMVDRALLVHVNETRLWYGLMPMSSIEEIREEDPADDKRWDHERMKMRRAIEAAINES